MKKKDYIITDGTTEKLVTKEEAEYYKKQSEDEIFLAMKYGTPRQKAEEMYSIEIRKASN